jgi:hypothetical protein
MITFPYSELPEWIKEKHVYYKGTPFLTWVKISPYVIRFNISLPKDVEAFLAEGWLLIEE